MSARFPSSSYVPSIPSNERVRAEEDVVEQLCARSIFSKLPVFLMLTNTDPFAAWFVVTEDATPDGIRVVRSFLGAISSFPIVAEPRSYVPSLPSNERVGAEEKVVEQLWQRRARRLLAGCGSQFDHIPRHGPVYGGVEVQGLVTWCLYLASLSLSRSLSLCQKTHNQPRVGNTYFLVGTERTALAAARAAPAVCFIVSRMWSKYIHECGPGACSPVVVVSRV